MNNELIVKRNQLLNEYYETEKIVKCLNQMLEKDIYFIDKKSIEALDRIKDFLKKKEERLCYLGEQHSKISHEILINHCLHEVIISDEYNTQCVICNRLFNNKEKNFNHFHIETTEKERTSHPMLGTNLDMILHDIINEIATKDENILDVFEEYFYDNHKLSNTKLIKNIKLGNKIQKKELLNIIKLNLEEYNASKTLMFIKNNIGDGSIEEKWFPNIEELKDEFLILKDEIIKAKETLKNSKEGINNFKNKCNHQIIIKYVGGFVPQNVCLLCDKDIDITKEKNYVSFLHDYDGDTGDFISGYEEDEIYNIIINILNNYEDDDEIYLIEELERLNLDNVKIVKNSEEKIRKRQEP